MTVNRRSFLKGMAAVPVVAAVPPEQKYEWKSYGYPLAVPKHQEGPLKRAIEERDAWLTKQLNEKVFS